jgi:hypothetical protein
MARRRPAEPAANPARGAALVVVAVLIGLVLLRNGLDTSEAITSTGGTSGTDSSATDGGDGGDGGDDGTTTTSTTVVARAPADVPTIVLNDSGIAGAAGKYSTALAALGYNLTNPAGANEKDPNVNSDVTVVYFAEGFEAEAAAVAVAIGAPETVVPVAMPAEEPGPIAGASVVVLIGLDIANLTPPAATG